jgi:hypothetical protein
MSVRILVHCSYGGLQVFVVFSCTLFLLKMNFRLNHDASCSGRLANRPRRPRPPQRRHLPDNQTEWCKVATEEEH